MAKVYNEKVKASMLAYQRKLKHLSIKVQPEYYDLVAEYAQLADMPIRQVIIKALEEYMESHPV